MKKSKKGPTSRNKKQFGYDTVQCSDWYHIIKGKTGVARGQYQILSNHGNDHFI